MYALDFEEIKPMSSKTLHFKYFLLESACILNISILVLGVGLIHVLCNDQSFVTTAPPPTGKGRDYDFTALSDLL